MSKNPETIIADAKRAARRLARTQSDTYQSCLDLIAQKAGRRNWGDFLKDPVDVMSFRSEDDGGALPFTTVEPAPDREPMTSEPVHFRPGNGEGIVLGSDQAVHLVRSSRQSTVVCIGAAARGKTTGVVLPTIATSPQASQIIHDVDGRLLADTLRLGCRSHTRIVVIDPLASVRIDGRNIERIAFNPLHPAYRLQGETPWEHASRVARHLLPITTAAGYGDYFNGRGRSILSAMACYLMEVPDEIPAAEDGRHRIASIPAIIEWMGEMIGEGDLARGFRRALDVCMAAGVSGEVVREFGSLIDMAAYERSGILGTADKGLLVGKNRMMTLYLDPADPAAGAGLAGAFQDADKPTTAFITGHRTEMDMLRTINALAVECVGRQRAQVGPSGRSLQILLDEADRIDPIEVVGDALKNGAPAGISILLTDRGVRTSPGVKTWLRIEGHVEADHVIVFGRPDEEDIRRIARMSNEKLDADMLTTTIGRHVVIEKEQVHLLLTPYLHVNKGGDQ